MRYKIFALFLALFFVMGCGSVIEVVTPTSPVLLVTPTPQVIILTPTPVPAPTASPLAPVPLPEDKADVPLPEDKADQGKTSSGLRQIILVVFLPLASLSVLWLIMESLLVQYFRPKSRDLTQVRVKAQDGLFMSTVISMTARKQLSLAAFTTRWAGALSFVEKEVEQVLIQEATHLRSIDDLERKLRIITNDFMNLDIIDELSRDFGIEVIRFNIEPRYSQETVDALNRKAEAAAGGTAYLAFADAAELEPDSAECRELYTVYQETTGQVDAYRNLGGGITNLAAMLSPREPSQGEGDVSND